MGKVIKKDYTSGKEVITDVSDEIIEILFVPRRNERIEFEIKRKDVQTLIWILQKIF